MALSDSEPGAASRELSVGRWDVSVAQATPYFNTKIPAKIMTPDRVPSRLGTLEFFDGMTTEATTATVLEHLTFLRRPHQCRRPRRSTGRLMREPAVALAVRTDRSGGKCRVEWISEVAAR
jgi:hypothetical protein